MSNEKQTALPEAPASATAKFVNKETQAEWMVTTRGHTFSEVIDRLPQIEEVMKNRGYVSFDAYVDMRRAEREQNKPQQPQAQQAPQQNGNGNGGEVLKCGAIELMPMPQSTSNPKLIWKIQTDKSKYPVPMYDEVCREVAPMLDNYGIDLALFTGSDGQPIKHSLAGWTAHYIENDKGWPGKIVGLTNSQPSR